MPIPLQTSTPIGKSSHQFGNKSYEETLPHDCNIELENCSTKSNKRNHDSRQQNDLIDCPVKKAHCSNDLRICHANAKATRLQLANLELPRTVEVLGSSIKIFTELSSIPTLDPLLTKERPSESALRYCDKVLSMGRRNGIILKPFSSVR